jgi:hypothetical protein
MDRDITVTVEDAYRERAEAVADRLRAAGMRVVQVLPTVGVITGTVPDSRRDAIVNARGVAHVEDQEVFRLPPPDTDQ